MTLQPGETGSVQVVFTPPAGLDPTQVPIFSGYLKVISTTDQELGSVNVPYFGVMADMSNLGSLAGEPDQSGAMYPLLGDATGAPVYNDSTIYTLAKGADDSVDAPNVVARFRLGSERISVDLVKADTTYKPTIAISDPKTGQNQRRDQLSRKHRRDAHSDVHSPHLRVVKRGPGSYDDIEIIGNVVSRSVERSPSLGANRAWQLSDSVLGGKDGNTVIPVQDGQYRFLLRVLKLFQNDWTDIDSYETYLSHAFTIKVAPSNTTSAP